MYKQYTGLTNRYIENELSYLPYFRGVYSCDLIPLEIANFESFSIVCNLAKHDVQNGHFVTINAVRDKLFYFDPFGLPPHNKFVKKFIAKCFRKHIFVNMDTFQSVLSNDCGYYAMLSVLLYHYPEYCEHVKFEKDNLLQNDILCKFYINDLNK